MYNCYIYMFTNYYYYYRYIVIYNNIFIKNNIYIYIYILFCFICFGCYKDYFPKLLGEQHISCSWYIQMLEDLKEYHL